MQWEIHPNMMNRGGNDATEPMGPPGPAGPAGLEGPAGVTGSQGFPGQFQLL